MAEVKREPEVAFEYCVLCSQNFSSQQESFNEENVFESVKACFSIPYPYDIDGAVCPTCRQRLSQAQRLKYFISDTLIKLNCLNSSRPDVELSEENSPCGVPPDVGAIKSEANVQHLPRGDNDFEQNAVFGDPTSNDRDVCLSRTKTFNCNVCSKDFSSRRNLKVHMAYHRDERKYKCSVCLKGFKTRCNLNNHRITHSDERNFKCGVCSKAYKTKRSLKVHMIWHSDERNFKCDVCFKAFKTRANLKGHMRSHISVKNLQCHVCSKTFKNEISLKMHTVKPHDDRNSKCDFNFEEFKFKWDLTAHMSIHSLPTVRVNLVRLEHLEQLVARVSADKLTYTVTPADISLSRSKEAECVKSTFDNETHPDHGSETNHQIKCAICSESCLNRDALINHLSAVHRLSEQFICRLCCKVFKTEYHLTTHVCGHTDKCTSEGDSYLNTSECRGQYFECDVCSKVFQRKKNLRVHILVHSDVRNFKCGVCLKCFKSTRRLNSHMISHSDVRNFICGVCFKAFKTNKSLKLHMVLHSDERNYKCTFCSKTFKYDTSLRLHVNKFCKFRK